MAPLNATRASNATRAAAAMKAMKELGVPPEKSKPVLKNLLKIYDNNWEYIEQESYRLFAEAIFDNQEGSEPVQEARKPAKKKNDDNVDDVQIRREDVSVNEGIQAYRTRRRVKQEDEHPSPSMRSPDVSGTPSLKRPRVDVGVEPELCPLKKQAEVVSEPTSHRLSSQQNFIKKGAVSAGPSLAHHRSERLTRISPQRNGRVEMTSTGEQQTSPVVGNRIEKRAMHEQSGNFVYLKKPKAEPGVEIPIESPIKLMGGPCGSESPDFEIPLAVMPPSDSFVGRKAYRDDSSKENASIRQANSFQRGEHHTSKRNENGSVSDSARNNVSALAYVQEVSSTNIDVASSSLGEVKLSLSCSADRPNFHMPNLEDIFKMVEDRCLKSYKILQPNFSLPNLMKEICQCVVELGSEPAEDTRGSYVTVSPALNKIKKPGLLGIFGSSPNVPLDLSTTHGPKLTSMNNPPNQKFQANNGNVGDRKKDFGAQGPADIVSSSLVVVQQPQVILHDLRQHYYAADISKGEEKVPISIANGIGREKYPSSFYYIPQNIAYQNAYINFSLARIGDEDCCSDCFGNCLVASIPCACARETGGEFAYTQDGVIRKEFLDECISKKSDPQEHHYFYCKSCPIERSKNEVMPDPCKGHLMKKFIKECWSKCGCSKQCGNRVVQRGITRSLEVFLTGEGKGWGVRTVEELPRGAFVYEYVGEILTNMELYDRNIEKFGNAKHTYPVLLDSDWGAEGVLKDEEALCLDATFYGNVARFVNHRCFDANLIDVPVEIETPDHHYYHLAFFTTRKVEANEELTWDYGIDFDDVNHPIKAFRCQCESKFCRDVRRTKNRMRKMKDICLG